MTFINPSGKLFAHMGRLAELQTGGNPWPINVEVDLSNRCSLGCEWCHFAYTHTRGPLKGKREKPAGAVAGGDLMDAYLAKDFLWDIAGKDISVTWTGGGEPTLHPAFPEIIVEAAESAIKQGVYTHGGHMGPIVDVMKEHLTFVYVSLDAADRESYVKAKGVDYFSKVLENVAKLVKAPGEATVGVGYLVTADNYQQAGDAAKISRELGADYIQFRPTIHFDQASPDVLQEQTGWLDDAVRVLRGVWADHGGFVEVDFDRFAMYRGWRGHGYRTCWWSALQTVVTPNGKMWTCVNKREHPAAEIGDLSVEPFEEIWARRKVAAVDKDCRVMCRGHVANLTLDGVMTQKTHAEFV